MKNRKFRALILVAAVSAVGACGLPRSGPSKGELLSGSIEKYGDTFVVAVDNRINEITDYTPSFGFPKSFRSAGQIRPDTISPGDVLALTIYENVDDGLLAGQGGKQSQLTQLQVDGAGYIFIPYAGRILAAGNTPERLRQIITEKLSAQTPDPQVVVTRLAGQGTTVSIVGNAGAQGVYTIEQSSRRISGMLAAAGGVTVDPKVAQVTVIRGNTRGKAWLQDIFETPSQDIALRGGDRILIEEDERAFTAVGATGGQARVPFEQPRITALEAISKVGGLNSSLADPKGVFILRDETSSIARKVLQRDDIPNDQRMIYVMDLTEPNGLFMARDFQIRDGDTVYVSEAPFVQLQKTLAAITGTASSVNSLNNIAN
ncbi:polysaccharide export outer membrane protein [Rhodovulum imhoffii]|uniref:Polysaccharide export outer membrane protein n=1 Tax=Rhodovulum imhoffii TaxID=365340 RepID=A0A2T5BVW6_9RHOB|nr:polysaccharide biosynthesis/export family protein [Rhodovulum imhoffii]MBK5933199.1 sugar ABC transporter substrate-binding protein [Rhodovulum imhoffii]PTN03700.1 polysaccharide export outer membrane protein [Rhodovulum imhoffii]